MTARRILAAVIALLTGIPFIIGGVVVFVSALCWTLDGEHAATLLDGYVAAYQKQLRRIAGIK